MLYERDTELNLVALYSTLSKPRPLGFMERSGAAAAGVNVAESKMGGVLPYICVALADSCAQAMLYGRMQKVLPLVCLFERLVDQAFALLPKNYCEALFYSHGRPNVI
ncbi:hypothetical protein QUB56_36010 [Microcoleus sp. AR_TQ3_B6]|uniref:hypothetical protein n=1 Tax=Microcoleus sp. AR_TQ3_B6 TaxID=3055284 RepID=UPI002FD68BFC